MKKPAVLLLSGGLDSATCLAIARSVIVGRHNGALSFQTRVGIGTVFTIRLPLAPPEREDGQDEDPDHR